MTDSKPLPPGVETAPQGEVVSLTEAARRLGKHPRTLTRAIIAGKLRGGAIPRPERHRWYVYVDQLPPAASQALSPAPVGLAEELRAQVISLQEANRLLIAAQQDLLEADHSAHAAADRYRAVAGKYLDALAQFMTPGHLGDLTSL